MFHNDSCVHNNIYNNISVRVCYVFLRICLHYILVDSCGSFIQTWQGCLTGTGTIACLLWNKLSSWRHQMGTFSTLLALCEGNSSVISEFHSQRPVTGSFGAFFDLHLNKRLSKQSGRWLFKTPSCSLWRHCDDEGNYAWGCTASIDILTHWGRDGMAAILQTKVSN